MIIKCSRFTNKKDEDDLLVLFIKDDEGNDIERYSFYLNKNNSKLDKELKNSIQQLPKLLESLYDKGLNRENVEFKNEVISIN